MPHGWLGERLMAATSVLIVGWSVLVACSGIATRPDEGGCYVGAAPVTCNVVRVAVTTDGPFTLVLNGATIQGTAAITQDVYDVALGTNVITGTTAASNLTILLSSVTTANIGVVQRASLASVAGPVGAVAACSITYAIPSGGARPQAFRANFTLYAGPDKC